MAAPNLQAPTTITGKTAYLNLADANETTLITNAASSNNAIRVTHITIVNTSASATATIRVSLYSAASGGTAYPMIANLTVPVGGSVIVVGKENPLWIEEDRRITATASAGNILTVVTSYEQIA